MQKFRKRKELNMKKFLLYLAAIVLILISTEAIYWWSKLMLYIILSLSAKEWIMLYVIGISSIGLFIIWIPPYCLVLLTDKVSPNRKLVNWGFVVMGIIQLIYFYVFLWNAPISLGYKVVTFISISIIWSTFSFCSYGLDEKDD
jgi:hypothetical protein